MFTNSKVGQNFGKEIESKLKDATHLEIASGYFSYRLLDKLTPNLKKIAKCERSVAPSAGCEYFWTVSELRNRAGSVLRRWCEELEQSDRVRYDREEGPPLDA